MTGAQRWIPTITVADMPSDHDDDDDDHDDGHDGIDHSLFFPTRS